MADEQVLDHIPPVLSAEEIKINELNAQIALQQKAIEDLESAKNRVSVQEQIQEIQNQLVIFNAGFIAIPLELELGYGKFGPNFLVVNDIYGSHKTTFETANGKVELKSINSTVRLVYRELVLSESNNTPGSIPTMGMMYATSTIKEVVIEDLGDKSIPLKYLEMLSEHKNMVANETLVNTLLDTFNFKGTLDTYKMKFNKTESQKYVDLSLQLESLQ